MPTFTTNYNLTLPIPLSPVDSNVWGPMLNNNTGFADNYFLSLANNFIGNSQPTIPATGLPANGQFWINNTNAALWTVSVYDGTNWVQIGSINPVSHTYRPTNGSTLNQRVITSSTTYSPTAGLSYAIVEVIGGGGGGAGSISGAGTCVGGAGGGGGYARSVLSAATIGASQTITIGAAGAGGAAGNNSGNAGGTTSFGALVIASGGAGGFSQINLIDPFDATIGGAGGAGTTGQLLVTGGDGQLSVFRGSPNTRLFGWAGAGGTSFYSGGATTQNDVNAAGNSSGGYGGGGGGGISTTISNIGGNGSAGVVVITEYI